MEKCKYWFARDLELKPNISKDLYDLEMKCYHVFRNKKNNISSKDPICPLINECKSKK